MHSAGVIIVIAGSILLFVVLFILEEVPGSLPFFVFLGLIIMITVLLESVVWFCWRFFSEFRRS
ncbi:MAG: hypothetical protein AB1473_00865 [Thermodesulfobacteriota bacterium]